MPSPTSMKPRTDPGQDRLRPGSHRQLGSAPRLKNANSGPASLKCSVGRFRPIKTPQRTTVEVAGSFNGWRKVPLSYDPPSRTWQIILNNIEGSRTHRYVI